VHSHPLRPALLCAALFLAPLSAQQFVVTTVAGGALPATPAPGVNVSLHYPRALFVDGAGSTYLTAANAVLKLDKNGVLTRFAGSSTAGYSGDGGPAPNARMYYPFGVTADQAGNVFIADLGNSVVRKVTPSGIISTYAGNGNYGVSGDGGSATQASLGAIGGIAVDSNGTLYLGDVGYQKIRKVAPDGTISTVLSSGVNSPWGLACDASGNVYIADANANVVRKMTPQGGLTTFAGTGTAGYAGDEAAAAQAQLSNPYGVSVDAAGNVYISDTGNNFIRKVDTKGIIRSVAGSVYSYGVLGDGGPATSAGLSYPQAAGVDSGGNLYICDLANSRIRKVTTDGIIHTAVGGGTTSGGDGGPASAAQLNGPYGTAADNNGNLYISDSLNNKVRKVASDGTITTIAGNGIQGYPPVAGGPALQMSFHLPWAVAADNHGNVIFADFYNGEVDKVDASGQLSVFVGSVPYPSGLSIDAAGNLYVVGYATSQIFKLDTKNDFYAFAGTYFGGFGSHYGGDGGDAMDASFSQPANLAADSNGNLYIADSGNQRVRKISSSGIVSTVAGNGTAGFSGDGGPATQAQLNYPYGVAVDPSGNVYIADTSNGRIRMVDSSGTITTVAGSNGFLYSGDGGLATNAVFDSPFGITADSHGNLFVADQYDSVVRMLTPKGQAPLFSITNSHPGLAIAGQPISSTVIVTNSAYAGATSGAVTVALKLPSSLTLSSIGGTGWSCAGTSCTRSDALAPGTAYPAITVNATLAASGSGQSISNAIVSGGGSLFSASAQDVMDVMPPGNYCSYSLDATAAALPPSTASGTVQVSTDAGCPWNAAADQAWVTFNGASSGSGAGSVSYSVAANSGAARTATLTIGGQSFSIRQSSAASAALPLAGVLAHFDSGATWESTITVVNTAATPAEVAVNFFDYQGNPVALLSTFPQTPAQATQQVATWDQTLAANALAVLDTRQSGTADTVGSAQLRAGAGVSGFEVFANLLSGQQAAVPLETRSAPSYLLAFDNTGQLKTGLAIANVSNAAANINVILRDDTGLQIGNETERLDAFGHDSFMLSNWSETQNKRGTVEFDTPPGGRITVLGLRVNGQALTTLPVLASVASGGGSLAHFQSGGGWQTTFTLANTGASAAPFTLKFYDANGAAAPLPLSSPELGDLGTTDTVTKTLQPNASVQLVTLGVSTQTGSARLDSTGAVSGFAVFRTDAGQEAVVPLETRQGTFVLAFDNTNGLATGLAIANFSAQAASVNVIVRDDTGTQIDSHTETLDGHGHDSFMLASTWSETGGKRGTVEFAPPSGASIGIIGIRAIPATGVVTTVPVQAK